MEQEQDKAKIDDLFEDEDIPFDIDNEPETQGREKPKSKRPSTLVCHRYYHFCRAHLSILRKSLPILS